MTEAPPHPAFLDTTDSSTDIWRCPGPGSPVILRLQQLELIFDAVTGVGGGELELLREVGGALRGQESERRPAPPMPHFLDCQEGAVWPLGSGDSFTHWSFERVGHPWGGVHLCPPAAPRGIPQKAPLSQLGWHRPPFKAGMEEAPSLPSYISWENPITPVSSRVCSSGSDPQSCPAPGVPCGVPPRPQPKLQRNHRLGVRESWKLGGEGASGGVIYRAGI